nr:protein timeless homolog [Lepeophtheirus salmonis]
MDWVAISPSSDMEVLELGYFMGDKYYLSDDAQEKLENTYLKLCDSASSKKTRQMIMFRNFIDTDIIPVISAHVEDNLFIYEAMIKVLSELTIPFEDYIDVFIKSNDSRLYRYELINFLDEVKNRFTNTLLLRKIITPAQYILKEDLPFRKKESNIIEHLFRLVANILSIPEPSNAISAQSVSSISHSTTTVSSSQSQRQNQIIWNFFAADLDKFILLAIEEDIDSNQWSTQILEVITLIFKDQSVSQLERILRELLGNPDLDDSYEDNESNLSSSLEDISMNEDSSDSYTQEKNGNANHLKNYNDDAMACQSSDSDLKEASSNKICGHNKHSTSINKTSSAELEETVKEMVNYWITTLPGDTKMDTEVSTESSSNDNDQWYNEIHHSFFFCQNM